MLAKARHLVFFSLKVLECDRFLRLVPENIEDLIAVISLYRPGPMESIPKYIRNKHNPSKVPTNTTFERYS